MSEIPEQQPQNVEALENEITDRSAGATDALTDSEISTIVRRLGSLVLDEATVLAEHQREAFGDIVDFFRGGGRETYIVSPTSTGKTVLFVKLSEQLIEAAPEQETRSRIIVLEPTIHLAEQTVGSIDPETGKKKGFKGFAPELDARVHHSQLSSRQRDANLQEADILVTTYNTFRNLIGNFSLAESKTPEEWDNEQHKYRRLSQEATKEVGELQAQRANYIRNTYITQEIGRARTDAKRLLRYHTRTGEYAAYAAHLQKIVDLATEDSNNLATLNKILRNMRALVPQRRYIADYRRPLKKAEKVDPSDASDDSNKEDTTGTQEAVAAENEVEFQDFNAVEQYAINFFSRHRYGMQPKRGDLLSHKHRMQVDEYSDLLRNARSKIQNCRNQIKKIDQLRALVGTIDRFDLMVLDEVHRAIGTETWAAIREYAQRKNIAILGLTATDKYFERDLADYFEKKAYELTKQEAMRREIINPVAMFVRHTGLHFRDIGIDASGDYDRLTMRQIRENHERNMMVVNDAKLLSENGYAGIIAAVPGQEGSHAKLLAKLCNEQEFLDPATGQVRPMRAEYVLGTMPKEVVDSHFAAFERGEIDWLVFIDLIREGWDSDRAKALLSARFTRSPLLATQRLGRIGRTFEGAPVSIAIDYHDGIEGQGESMEIPPVLAADVFEVDNVEQGYVVGNVSAEHPVLAALRATMPEKIEAHHSRFVKVLESAYTIDSRGIGFTDKEGQSYEWQTFEALQKGYRGYLPKELLLEAVNAPEPAVRAAKGRRGAALVPLFNVRDVEALYQDKPEVNPWKLYVDQNGQKWITPEGCTRLLSKRFPYLQASQVSDLVRTLETDSKVEFEKSVGRVRLNFRGNTIARLGLTHMYKLEEITDRLVPYMLEKSESE